MFVPTISEVVIMMGPFVDDTDGKTAETGLAGSMTVRLSKDGASSAARHSTTAITHDNGGYYLIPLDTTDTGFVGPLTVFASASGALPVKRDLFLCSQTFYEAMVIGEPLPADVKTWDGDEDAVANAGTLFGNATGLVNLADFYDGTGYNAAASTVGTVTNIPAGSADVTKLSGSTTAATNLKKMFDGTGYNAAAPAIGTVANVTNQVNANLANINATAALFTAFQALLKGAIVGTVVAGTNTATVVSTGLSSATTGLYVGKMLIVTSGTRAGEGGKMVTAYDGSTKRLTVEAMTGALSAGDTFVLVG